jgi:hypothetical protein
MNNKSRITVFGMMCLVWLSGLLIITSCGKDDQPDTDQMSSSKITLRAFGPSPALRGGELRFIGTNMDKVTGIIIPGVDEIIDFTMKEKTEIRVIIPQNATEGRVILVTPEGEITTTTLLTFEEPIVIDSITVAKVKAGNQFEITGDYLNLIAKVVFTENAIVEKADFVSQERGKIVVIVPREARSGEIMLSNGADIPIEVYSGDRVATIVEPIIQSVTPVTVKAGSTLTIKGSDFDLVESVIFTKDNIAPEFNVNEDKTSITVQVPADAQDGPVTLKAYSEVEVPSAALTMKMPVVTITDKKVKNGTTVSVAGTDLDLVTAVWFGDAEAGFTYANNAITVTVPATANSNFVKFVTASTKEAEVTGISYVKPEITNITPVSLTAGDNITITGTNLDLVSSVLFAGADGTVSVTLDAAPGATSFSVKTPLAATNGPVTLVMTNGMDVTSTQNLTIASALPVITSMPMGTKPGSLITVTGTLLRNVTKVEFVYLGDGAVVAAPAFLPSAEGNSMQIYTPTKGGKAKIRLTSENGTTETDNAISIGVDPVTDPSLVIFNFEDRGTNNVADNSWNGVGQKETADGVSGAYYKVTAARPVTATWQFLFSDNWCEISSGMAQVSGISNYVLKMDVRFLNDLTISNGSCRLDFSFGGSATIDIAPYLRVGDVFTTDGEWMTITIPLTDVSGLPDPTPQGGDWTLVANQGTPIVDFVGFCVDNVRYEHK